MNYGRLSLFALFLGLSFGFGWSPLDRLPGRLIKAFEALEVYNYFQAKDLFEKSLNKDPVGAGYGLSIIYGRDDNPFFEIDQAHHYISRADSLWPGLDPKSKLEYAEIGVDSVSIENQLRHVDSLAFLQAARLSEIDHWNDYIQIHTTVDYREMAVVQRNSLAFEAAVATNTAAAYEKFLQDYPDASQEERARGRHERLKYEETISVGNVEDYKRYMELYPDGPFYDDAELAIYDLYTTPDMVDDYLRFIREQPENSLTDRAWRRIYSKEIGDESARAIASFSMKYPEYPFAAELRTNFALATTRFYPFSADGKWGFIDEDGKQRIKPFYEWSEAYSEGFAVVSRGDKITFVDKSGNHLTGFVFDEAFSFKNGYAVVEKNGKMGLIDRAGFFVIEPEYDECGEFSEGMIYVARGEQYGYMNGAGKKVIDFIYDDATDFRNGLAMVEKDGLNGFINMQGEVVIDFKYDWVEPFGEANVARMKTDDLYGVIDRGGNICSEPIYDAMGEPSGNLLLAAKNGKYGFVNLNGDTAIKFQYDFNQTALQNSHFRKGYARVYQKDKSEIKVGVIDSDGKKIFPAIFEDVGDFEGKLIPVKKKGKWGYADRKMNLVIPYQFDEADTFGDSLARASKNGLYGLIDSTGKAVLNFQFRQLHILDSLFLVSDTANLHGIVNVRNDTLVPFQYSTAEIIDDFVIRFTDSDDLHSYYDYRRLKFIWRKEEL